MPPLKLLMMTEEDGIDPLVMPDMAPVMVELAWFSDVAPLMPETPEFTWLT